jgi:hypothetical protein
MSCKRVNMIHKCENEQKLLILNLNTFLRRLEASRRSAWAAFTTQTLRNSAASSHIGRMILTLSQRNSGEAWTHFTSNFSLFVSGALPRLDRHITYGPESKQEFIQFYNSFSRNILNGIWYHDFVGGHAFLKSGKHILKSNGHVLSLTCFQALWSIISVWPRYVCHNVVQIQYRLDCPITF